MFFGNCRVRVADWIERLQREGVRGADLVFACIGPALEIFSRYRLQLRLLTVAAVELPEYLEKVWEVVGRTALRQVLAAPGHGHGDNGLAGAFEEDSRLTALFLWTLQKHGRADDLTAREEVDRYRGRGEGGRSARLYASLRCGAPVRPTHGHQSRSLEQPYHRSDERA